MPADSGADAIRGSRRHHPVADMAVAYDLVELLVGDVEEAFRFTVGIVPQALLAKNRILEGDRQRRTIAPHNVAFARRPVFSARKGGQGPVGVASEKFRPALETLRPIQMHRLGSDVGYGS
jgi:hypothetical protein